MEAPPAVDGPQATRTAATRVGWRPSPTYLSTSRGSTGPADHGHLPAAARHQGGAGAAGAAAGPPRQAQHWPRYSSPRQGVCSRTARWRRHRGSAWTRPRRRTSPTSAVAWMGCRWRSSWRPPGAAPLVWPRWPTASPGICSCWSQLLRQACTGRWPQPSSGLGNFSTRPNGTCWAPGRSAGRVHAGDGRGSGSRPGPASHPAAAR